MTSALALCTSHLLFLCINNRLTCPLAVLGTPRESALLPWVYLIWGLKHFVGLCSFSLPSKWKLKVTPSDLPVGVAALAVSPADGHCSPAYVETALSLVPCPLQCSPFW